MCLLRLHVCVFASRDFAGGSGDLGACRSCCDAATDVLRVWGGLEYWMIVVVRKMQWFCTVLSVYAS